MDSPELLDPKRRGLGMVWQEKRVQEIEEDCHP